MSQRTVDRPSGFGNLLRRRRQEAGLTQESLAEQAGISANAVAALERGRRTRPRPDTVTLLADALTLDAAAKSEFIAASMSDDNIRVQEGKPSAVGLPASGRPLFGRDADVAAILALLREQRLITLTGPGGIGKTRLATAVITTLYEGGREAAFVDLAPVHDPSLVATVIGDVLGLDQGGANGIDGLKAYLRDREFLLTLDNFERIVRAASLVAELLDTCPRLRILVTSRIPLRLRAEHRFSVPPLSAGVKSVDPGKDGSAFPAVRLFIARARQVDPSFEPDQESVRAIAEVCRQLDGLPLAIELAAARTRLIPPQALLERLEQRLTILTGGSLDLPARHQSLRTALDWSHDFLTSEEQRLFAALAVFDGGAALEAIERTSGAKADVLFGGLESLLDESLVVQSTDDLGRPRFGMLQTIFEYAREKLVKSGGEPQARARHAAYFVDLAEAGAEELTGPEQAIGVKRMGIEHGNFREALRWSLDSRQRQSGLRLGAALWRFWFLTGHLTEGRRWLDELLETFPEDANYTVEGSLRARVLRANSSLASQQTDFPRAEVLGLEALAAMRRTGDTRGTAETLNALGMTYRNWGHYDRAITHFDEALQIYRDLHDRRGVAVVLNNMGTAAVTFGDLDRASVLQEESLGIRRRIGDTWGIAMVLNNMAEVAFERGRLSEAAAYCKESLGLRRELGDQNSIALVLATLGTIARAQNEMKQALEYHQESLRISRDLDHPGLALSNLQGIAEVRASHCGETLQAARLLGAVEAMTGDMRVSVTPMDRARFEATVEKVKKAHGNRCAETWEQFDTAWRLGRSLTIDRAIEEALALQSMSSLS